MVLCIVCLVGCHGERAVDAVGSGTDLKFIELKAKHDERLQKYRSDVRAATSEADAARISEQFRQYWLPAIDEMLKFAEAEPSTGTSVEAAIWILSNCDSDYEPHVRAAQLLAARHPHPESLPAELYQHLDGYEPVYEHLLRLGAKSNPARQANAIATFELANLLCNRADFKDMAEATPQLGQARMRNLGGEVVQHLESTSSEHDRLEAKELYERVQQVDDIRYRDRPLSELARERLLPFTQTFPEIGKPAPNIDAVDLEGNRLTLENLRGKVVVVTFWASWCGPCLARIPEENALVEDFAEANFVFMGVNGDTTLKDAQRAVETESIRFNSWWDNPEADETIAARWGVRGWPTTYVIDQTGTIRYKNLSVSDLRRVVGQLLALDGPAATSTLKH